MQGLASAPAARPPACPLSFPRDVDSKCSLLLPLFNSNHKKGVRNYILIVQSKEKSFVEEPLFIKTEKTKKTTELPRTTIAAHSNDWLWKIKDRSMRNLSVCSCVCMCAFLAGSMSVCVNHSTTHNHDKPNKRFNKKQTEVRIHHCSENSFQMKTGIVVKFLRSESDNQSFLETFDRLRSM